MIQGGAGGAFSNGGHGIDISGGTTTIVNMGMITGGAGGSGGGTVGYGINVSAGTVTSLTNAQGGGTPLTYNGALPTNYYIYVTSVTSYGKLVVTSPTGSMTFGVDAGSSLANHRYTNAVTGVSAADITNEEIDNTVGNIKWKLTANGATDTWDLLVTLLGPDAANTLASLTRNGFLIRDALTQRAASITNAMDYDCRDFSAQNMCVSFQARYTGFDGMSDGAGVLTAAYRLDNNFRVGAFIDQRAVQTKKTGLDYSGDMPTVGAFLGYSQRVDGTGLQAKLAGASNTGNITATRDTLLANTEAGSGKSSLNSWALAAEMGWGVAIGNKLIATPYVGLRYTDVTRGSYSETATVDVTSPLSYSSFYQRQTTAAAGVRFAGLLTDKIGYQVGLGGEYDVGRNANHYSGTSAIAGLETFSVNTNTTTNRMRANASAGLSFAIDKNQKLTTSVSVRQQAYSSQPSVNAMAGYQIGF